MNHTMHRFYHAGSLDVREIELIGAEAQHLGRVLRLGAGDRVEVFDGKGQAVSADVVSVSKRSALLSVVGPSTSPPAATPSIRLLCAAPKSDRLRWMVEKLTELGVSRLSLLQTGRSIVHPGAGKLDKLHAAVLSACKQCGRNDLMAIDPPRPWEQMLEEVRPSSEPLLVADPGSPGLDAALNRSRTAREMTLAIGPEGGWDSGEVEDAIKQGAVPVGLGPLTLRIETAAIAAVSAIRLSRG